MALSIQVTKGSVRLHEPATYYITLNLTVTDDSVEVINQSFECNYSPGQDPEAEVKALKNKMQEAIDKYKAEKTIYDHAKLNTAVTWLNNNLTV